MDGTELDNPCWWTLSTRHRSFARRVGNVARYRAEFAPFLGTASPEADAEDALASLVAPNETVLVLGVAPKVSRAWQLDFLETIAQMTSEAPIDPPDGPEITPLGTAHAAEVLALIALVYPHYFRPRTMELGRYFGIYQDGRLAAMIGERLATATWTELSAICTHPDYLGRGYASRLIAFLTHDVLARGGRPFLHVSYENPHAQALYERLGYRVRRDLPFWSLRRISGALLP